MKTPEHPRPPMSVRYTERDRRKGEMKPKHVPGVRILAIENGERRMEVAGPRIVLPWGNLPAAPGMFDIPMRGSGRAWLREALGGRITVKYLGHSTFCVARLHTAAVLDVLVERYGEVWIDHEFYRDDKCVDACWKARPWTREYCVCGCGGVNHGAQAPWGKEVADGLSVKHEKIKRFYIRTLEK